MFERIKDIKDKLLGTSTPAQSGGVQIQPKVTYDIHTGEQFFPDTDTNALRALLQTEPWNPIQPDQPLRIAQPATGPTRRLEGVTQQNPSQLEPTQRISSQVPTWRTALLNRSAPTQRIEPPAGQPVEPATAKTIDLNRFPRRDPRNAAVGDTIDLRRSPQPSQPERRTIQDPRTGRIIEVEVTITIERGGVQSTGSQSEHDTYRSWYEETYNTDTSSEAYADWYERYHGQGAVDNSRADRKESRKETRKAVRKELRRGRR